MINVVVISHTPDNELGFLERLADINISAVIPSTMDKTLQQALADSPDIIVMEQNLETLNVDILCHLLHLQDSKAQIIILTDEEPTFEMLKNTGFSVRGYMTKEQRSSLAKAVRVINEGEAWLPRTIVTEMLNRFAQTNPDSNEEPKLKLVN